MQPDLHLLHCAWNSSRNESAKAQETVIFQLLVESLRPLHQQWHLLQLVNEAALNDSAPIIFLAGQRSANGVQEKIFGLSDVAKLYSNLLPAFAVLNPFGGALPVLNLLAFTPMLLPQLWDWLQTSPGLDHLINLKVETEAPTKERLESEMLIAEKEAMPSRSTGSRLAAAFGWRSRSRSCFALNYSSNLGRSSPFPSTLAQRQEILPGRMSVDTLGGGSSRRTPEPLSVVPPRMSVDRPRSFAPRMSVDRPGATPPRLTIDEVRVSDNGAGNAEMRRSSERGLGTERPFERQSFGHGRRSTHGRTEASRSVDIQWAIGASRSSSHLDAEPARRSVDAEPRRRPGRRRGGEPSRPLDILESIR